MISDRSILWRLPAVALSTWRRPSEHPIFLSLSSGLLPLPWLWGTIQSFRNYDAWSVPHSSVPRSAAGLPLLIQPEAVGLSRREDFSAQLHAEAFPRAQMLGPLPSFLENSKTLQGAQFTFVSSIIVRLELLMLACRKLGGTCKERLVGVAVR